MEKVQIEKIRFDATWNIRHEVMYPHLPYDAIKLENDEIGIHFGLFVNNKLTAVVSLFNTGNTSQFRKFATLTSAQGKGYGTQLLNYVINYVKDMGSEKIWCNARVSAAGFYGKFGFTQTNQRSVSNGIDFVIMELQLNN